MIPELDLAVIGAGAAGCFGAIRVGELCSTQQKTPKILIFESGPHPLTKVKISGGGRCNVTHSCFDPTVLVNNYPRGSKELRSVFSQFQPADTVRWFQARNIELKVEPDGRMFPTTDSSSTIIDCFLGELEKYGIEILLREAVAQIEPKQDRFLLTTKSGNSYLTKNVFFTTGSNPSGHKLLAQLNHSITELAPSLFTFHATEASKVAKLAGVSCADVALKITDTLKKHEFRGPLLFTHWGFSGPAVLKLSAFGARDLQALRYKFTLQIDWLPNRSHKQLEEIFSNITAERASAHIANITIFREQLARRHWEFLLARADIELEKRSGEVSKKQWQRLISTLKNDSYAICKKSTFKEEFVTCGGVNRKEVDFRRLESKLHSRLFFAGEVLDIDGITGGFNFQNAWSGAWIAAQAISESLQD